MKPANILRKIINATGNNSQLPELNAAETATQTLGHPRPFAQSDQHEQACHSVESSIHPGRNFRLATLPLMPAENCPFAEGGQNCIFWCVLCSLRHECIYCGFKERQENGLNYDPPFRDPVERPTNTPAPHIGSVNNDQADFPGASDKEVGQISSSGTSAVQLEGMSQEDWGEYAATNNAKDKEILPQPRLAYWPENSNRGREESPLEAKEYDEDEIDSQAETDPLVGYACVLCDEPDDAEDMVGCELDTGWFHLSCVGLTKFPAGKWYCHYCVGNQSYHAGGQAALPHVDPGPRSEEKATLPKTTPSEQSKSTSSNLPHVANASKQRTISPKRPKPAIYNPTPSQNVPRKENWKDDEKNYVIALMQEVVHEGETTEKKWAMVSSRLMSRYAVDRSMGSVKNWWNRHGRALSNIDERIVPKPDKLKTGRRKGRQSIKRGAEDVDGDHIDSDMGGVEEASEVQQFPVKRGGKHRSGFESRVAL